MSNKKSHAKKIRDTLFAYSFLIIPVFLIAVFSYYPSISGSAMAFQDAKQYDMYNRPWCGLENFERLFSSSINALMWKNTFLWMVGVTTAEFIVGFGLALLLTTDFPGRKIYEAVVFVPWALSGFVVGVIWKWMFNGNTGVINDILMRLGLIEQQIGFLSSTKLAIYCVMIAKVWTGMAFFAIVAMAALRTVPKEMHEAAEIDGANSIQRFFYITIPTIKKLLLITILMRSMGGLGGGGDLIIGMTNGGPAGRSHTAGSYIMTEVLTGTDYGMVSAAGLCIWFVTMVYMLLYLFVTKAMKGSDD